MVSEMRVELISLSKDLLSFTQGQILNSLHLSVQFSFSILVYFGSLFLTIQILKEA